MQKKIIGIFAAGCLTAFCGEAFGSACTADDALTSASTGASTCDGTDQLVKTCGDTTPIGNAKEYIYSVSLGTGNDASITVTGTGFNPYVALMAGADCNSLDTCQTNNSENAGAADAGITVGPTNAPTGSYFLVITDPSNAAACGAFTLDITGTLPVKLQEFSVD
jgi:hypothetical protein